MSTPVPQNPAPPMEVLVEFLNALQRTVGPYDRIVPVLRGSTLLRRWFGDAARPAIDIDLEWFPHPSPTGRLGPAIEHARRLCLFSADNHYGFPIVFDQTASTPSDGVNLWEYDTPGVRLYTGWTWNDRGLGGLLQVDIAQAGSYDLDGVVTETIEFPREWGEPARCLAYAPEMLLAAKLSWIVRHARREAAAGAGLLACPAEPKDLFDAHLLLTEGSLRPEVFQNALLAVAVEDRLDWSQLDVLLDQGLELSEGDRAPGWTDFFDRHSGLIHALPDELLQTVIARLRPLVADLRQHLPFLLTLEADPVDEVNYQAYADWLEDRADPRAEFLRVYCRYLFRADRRAHGALASLLPGQPGGWLYYVLGGAERSRELRKQFVA